MGRKPKPQKPSEAVVHRAVGYIRKWQPLFGLNSWSISVRSTTLAALEEKVNRPASAAVELRQASFQAEVEVAWDWEWESGGFNNDLERTMMHELAHIRLHLVETMAWELVGRVEDLVPEVMKRVMRAQWEEMREEAVETLVAVAKGVEEQWKK